MISNDIRMIAFKLIFVPSLRRLGKASFFMKRN